MEDDFMGLFVTKKDRVDSKNCPKCGAIYPISWSKCINCHIPLMTYEEYKNRDMYKVNKQVNAVKARENIENGTFPTCPTCGSTNVEKISTAAKVGGAAMFGLLSKTARSQFKCKNCGYKW